MGLEQGKQGLRARFENFVANSLTSLEQKALLEWLAVVALEEQRAWLGVLGSKAEVKPLPSFVTPDVREKARDLGMELCYLPGLTSENLAQNNKNLPADYWSDIILGYTEKPKLQGKWIIVERKGEILDSDPILKVLKRESRWGKPAFVADELAGMNKNLLLDKLGIPIELEMRLLKIVEWNLLARRWNWFSYNFYEWTGTTVNWNEYHSRFYRIRGRTFSKEADVDRQRYQDGPRNTCFRLAIDLGFGV